MDLTLYIFLWHFLIGVISILIALGWLVYFQSGEKSFMYYGIFALLVMAYLIIKTPFDIYNPKLIRLFYESRYYPLSYFIQICFYLTYFHFFINFLELDTKLPNFTKKLKLTTQLVFLISTLVLIYCITTVDRDLFFNFFTFIALPFILIMAFIAYFKAFKTKGILKYFIVGGSIFYTAFSLKAMYMTLHPSDKGMPPITYFFIGLLFENIAFSLGLSFKVKSWYENMIFQLKENVRIRKNQYDILENEVKAKEKEILEMTRIAEQARIKKVESDFNNEIRRLQLDLLKNQMNPHFIFNALTSIKVFLIDNDKKKAVFYLNKFSKLIRKMLDSYRVDSYSLDEEFEILKLYLAIENIRFNSEIEISFDVDEKLNLKSIYIPPLLLQPFVENAIWHGLMNKTTGTKQLDIKIYSAPDTKTVFMEITDNGVGRKYSTESKLKRTLQKTSYGLKLVQERLDIFNIQNNFNYKFRIIDLFDENSLSAGTKVFISFEKG